MKNNVWNIIRYANCWEDADILIKALDISETDTGLSIISGGDNTLALLTKNPKSLVALDVNPYQIYVFELKMACFRTLDYDTTLKFLGIRECDDRPDIYSSIRSGLESAARNYFDSHREIVEKGIIFAGKFEHYFRLFRKYIRPLFTTERHFRRLGTFTNTREQMDWWNRYINNRRFQFIFKIFFGARVMGRLGRDSSFYDYVDDKKSSGERIRARFEFGLRHNPGYHNPYLNFIVNGNYSEEALPLYLRKNNYEVIRNNLDRIRIVRGSLNDIFGMTFDFFNLSDIFEYMNREDFRENVKKLDTLASPGARLAYWNMQNHQTVDDKSWRYLKSLSEDLFRQDQAFFYQDFQVYQRM